MNILTAIMTDQTCGDACWHAREDICRCSCGGRNHGILRTADGERPVRTRKLQGFIYELLAVETTGASCRAVSMRPIDDLARDVTKRAIAAGKWDRYAWSSTPGYPVKVKTAAPGEIERWPELAAWREDHGRPIVAWIRADLKEYAKS